ncbi:MAG: nuclear transport factor 2 family protein [Acidobacteriia bacterium]|nr:nuclear transport factor 2 family protein [Terriglobia bacterium]
MTVEQVQQEVRRYWQTFSANDAESLANFYANSATIFNSTGSHLDFSVAVELGDVQVQLLGPDAGSAVASYTLRLRRDLAKDSQLNDPQVNDPLESEESLIEYGRVSQVFTQNAERSLCIVHEHLSLPEAGRWEKMERKALIDLVRVPA